MKSKGKLGKKKNIKLGNIMTAIIILYAIVICSIFQFFYNSSKSTIVTTMEVNATISNLSNTVYSINTNVMNIVNNYEDMTGDERTKILDEIIASRNNIQEFMNKYPTLDLSDTEKSTFNDIYTQLNSYGNIVDSIVITLKDSNIDTSKVIYNTEFNKIQTNTQTLIVQLTDNHNSSSQDKITTYATVAFRFLYFMVAFNVGILVLVRVTQKTLDKQSNTIKQSEDTIKSKQNKLEYLGYTDVLTDCLSRGKFFMDMEKERIKSIKSNEHVFMTLVNITDFKTINLSYGYNVGDEVLYQVSSRLKTVNPNVNIYRLGSDEFIYLLKYEDTKDNAYSKYMSNLDSVLEELFKAMKITDSLVGNLSYKVGVVHLDIKDTINGDVALKCQEAVNYCRINQVPAFIYNNLSDSTPEEVVFSNN